MYKYRVKGVYLYSTAIPLSMSEFKVHGIPYWRPLFIHISNPRPVAFSQKGFLMRLVLAPFTYTYYTYLLTHRQWRLIF